MNPKAIKRALLTVATSLVTVALLSLAPVDAELATRLVAERLSGDLLRDQPVAQRPADQMIQLTGDDACLAGIRTSLQRRTVTNDENATPASIDCSVADGSVHISLSIEDQTHRRSRALPTWHAVLPPVLAVFVALGTRQLLLGLVLAVLCGAILSNGLDLTLGIYPAIRDFVWPAVSDRFRLNIVLFTSALVGMANITTRAGGAQGIAQAISKLARGTRSTRMASFLMGLALFFDDYANCIVVGTTMRPLADRVKLSREKLAYIVDSTAAPVAGVAIISTWIGYEVSLFADLSTELALGTGGYELFLRVLPSRFYCFLTLGFVVLSTILSRDFGPMLKAELRAQREGKVLADDANPLTSRILMRVKPVDGVPPRWPVAAIPVACVIAATVVGLVTSGAHSAEVSAWVADNPSQLLSFEYIRLCLQNANGAFVLLNAALIGTIAAIALGLTRRRSLGENRSRKRAGASEALLAAAIPLAFGLAVLLIQGGSSLARSEGDLQSMVDALLAPSGSRVVLFGALIAALLLVVQVSRRMVTERTHKDVEFPLSVRSLVVTWLSGARAMVLAICILVLAWSIQAVCQALDTSVFLVASLSGALDPLILPVLVFILSAAVAFSTGTSWGTMGILIPTVMPLAFHFGGLPLVLVSAGAVLDGAIFGDHCSPISDTTVLSSMASGCDHIHHVRTQLPYALTCMTVAIAGYLLATAGAPLWLAYGVGCLVLVGVLFLFGKSVGK